MSPFDNDDSKKNPPTDSPETYAADSAAGLSTGVSQFDAINALEEQDAEDGSPLTAPQSTPDSRVASSEDGNKKEEQVDPSPPPGPSSQMLSSRRLQKAQRYSVRNTNPDAQALPSVSETRRSSNAAPFRSSIQDGLYEVEQLADRTDKREAKKVLVTRTARGRFLKTCRRIAAENPQYGAKKKRIHERDLRAFRDRIHEKVESSATAKLRRLGGCFGFRSDDDRLLNMLNRGMEIMEQAKDDWFMFEEFNLLHTRRESRWPWMRSNTRLAAIVIFCWYFFTAVLFCAIMDDEGVCPSDPNDEYPFYGWLTSLYFASTTIATVGYGDVTVSKDERWRVFIGAIYMLGSLLISIFAISSAVDEAFSPFARIAKRIAENWYGKSKDKLHLKKGSKEKEAKNLYSRIRFIQFARVMEIILQVTVLNLVGIFVSRYFTNRAEEEAEQWTWMTAFYWSVQTTTTIGYGDLSMPFELRWFQIFYLTISTYAVGNALGKLAKMKNELRELRNYYAWREREVTKSMIEDMQAYVHDDIIDEYEFIVSSLLSMGKLKSSDVHLIMDKFKELAGQKGYIAVEDGV